MKSFRMSVLVLALATVLLGACASVPPAERSSEDGPCVLVRKIKSSQPLDNFHVLVVVKGGDHYLLRTGPGCLDLKTANSVSIPGRTLRICGDGASSFSYHMPFKGTRRCQIIEVDKVADEEEALALAELHAKE